MRFVGDPVSLCLGCTWPITQVNSRATFRELDSDQAHNNIKENVSNDAPLVLNIDDVDIHIVSIILYERTQTQTTWGTSSSSGHHSDYVWSWLHKWVGRQGALNPRIVMTLY